MIANNLESAVHFSRTFSMPNQWTFQIKPIKKLLSRYVKDDGINWIDPFSGQSQIAYWTNDLNTANSQTIHHLDALEFAKLMRFRKFAGVLFDPPYSLRQIKECYDRIGLKLSYEQTLDASFGKVKDMIGPLIEVGGYAICFGWNSNGFGKDRGFSLKEILLVQHGGHHNDTICTVERKVQSAIGGCTG